MKQLRLAGSHAAFARQGDSTTRVTSVDLRNGTVRRAAAGAAVTALALRTTGAVAWITEASITRTVRIREASGEREAARSETIEPASLAISDGHAAVDHVYWTDAGRASSTSIREARGEGRHLPVPAGRERGLLRHGPSPGGRTAARRCS